MGWRLYCPRCGFRGGSGEYYPWCLSCGGPLEVEGAPPRYGSVMGEGATPIVDFRGVLLKLEYLNPTGSFKDRGASYSLQLARDLGYECVVVDSSGNTAVSVAAYAGRLGLEARVYIPRGAGGGKRALVKALGARVFEAGSREEAAEASRREASRCFHVAHLTSPFFLEGMKSLGLELAEYAEGADVILPVSSGSLLLGVYRGLRESGASGFRLIAVQSPMAASLRGMVKLLGEAGGPMGSLLDALVVKNPPRLGEIAEAIKSTGGGLVVVGDDSVKPALRELVKSGFIVEPSSASAWAAYRMLKARGVLKKRVIVVLTGSGLKYPEALADTVTGS